MSTTCRRDQKQADPTPQNVTPAQHSPQLSPRHELGAALVRAASDSPFVERLVHFWANHFAVSVDKLPVIGLAGLLEFEAIRPHVLGRFADMLLAVEQHPAMLALSRPGAVDRAQFARRQFAACAAARQRGLNENLAREIMELHTLGVRTGYSQADVTEFARALTGWTVGGLGRGPAARMLGNAPAGDFQFADLLHEPGDRTIMGQRYARWRRSTGARGPDGPRRQPGDGEASRDQARAPLRRRRPADRPRRPAEQGLSRAATATSPHSIETLIELPEAVGRRSRSSSRRRGNGRILAARARVARASPLRPRRTDEPARPADVAAGFAGRLR